MNRAELIARVPRLRWFHAMDFGDCRSPGRFPEGQPPNVTLFPIMDLFRYVDLTGMTCLDVGCASGLSSFGMKMKGARRVVATDIGEMGEPFRVARELLGLDVEFVGHTSFDNILQRFPAHQFDVMVCAGVMYHMLNPCDCILKARKLLKRNGLLFLETAFHASDKGATIDLNSASGRLKEVYTYWVPSKFAVTGMLKLAGFNVLAIRAIHSPDRIASAARNVQFHELRDRSDSLKQRHEKGIQDPTLLAVLPDEASSIQWSGPHDDTVLDWRTYVPDFPPHPASVPCR